MTTQSSVILKMPGSKFKTCCHSYCMLGYAPVSVNALDINPSQSEVTGNIVSAVRGTTTRFCENVDCITANNTLEDVMLF